ncbi:MAG TPA: SOS response-associated peptidase [Candidatus Kapabacteria bacterium]|nr:SOS response-associated peptidase [Candidatus Kapabacteria bacterium]HPO62977.1 SOS response-associated peptidase [Candidatus Kapabacteria bacterium]
MCGRFALSAKTKQIEKLVPGIKSEIEITPRYNIAPSQNVLSVLNSNSLQLNFLKWGLIPFWSKDEKIGSKLINARIETVQEKPAFRNSLKSKRCIIFADGFYEWDKNSSVGKIPYFIKLKSNEPFAFAGLWDSWKNTDNTVINSCSIITTQSNELMKNIHSRMPVILQNEIIQKWLSNDCFDMNLIEELKEPYSSDKMEMYRVSTIVNSPMNDNPLCTNILYEN